jgi:hypothetical protein
MIDANSAAEARDQMFNFIQEVHDIVGRTANDHPRSARTLARFGRDGGRVERSLAELQRGL